MKKEKQVGERTFRVLLPVLGFSREIEPIRRERERGNVCIILRNS